MDSDNSVVKTGGWEGCSGGVNGGERGSSVILSIKIKFFKRKKKDSDIFIFSTLKKTIKPIVFRETVHT